MLIANNLLAMLPPNPNPAPPDRLSTFDRELFAFLKSESDAARTSLRDEATANREVLLGTLKIVAYPLTAVIAIAGVLGWRSLGDLKQTIRNEAQQETKLEITRMQQEIRSRLNNEFQTPELQRMVSQAAKEQTGVVLHPLIVKEVSTDVAQSVSREQAAIKTAVVVQTRDAVNDLKPTVNGIVEARVNSTVDQAVEAKIAKQVTPVLNTIQRNEQTSNLILSAQGEDGASFDQLANSLNDPTLTPQEKAQRLTTVSGIMRQHNQGFYNGRGFIDHKSDDELLSALHDPNAYTRQAAMDTIPIQKLKDNMPFFMQVMMKDPSLIVREAAFRRFEQIRNDNDPKHHIENLDNYSAMQWWIAHQAEFTSKPK